MNKNQKCDCPVHKCQACDGTGKVKSTCTCHGGDTCSYCDGTGRKREDGHITIKPWVVPMLPSIPIQPVQPIPFSIPVSPAPPYPFGPTWCSSMHCT